MRFQNIQIIFFPVLIVLCMSCTKNKLSAQEQYAGKAKHASVSAEFRSINAADYDFSKPISGALKDSLNGTIERLFPLTGMPGISVAMLVPRKGFWYTTQGYLSKQDNIKADTTSVFYWASVGKLLTATIIDQLVLEGKLSYQDKLSKWFPKFEQSSKITIEQLLNHTSGLASFNTNPAIFYKDRAYSTEELIKIALGQKNLFKPGAYWSYSNTGYLLLALIIQQQDQQSYAEALKRRLTNPLALSSLRALTAAAVPANLALAHDRDMKFVDEKFAVPLGAGNIAGNAKDMVSLLYAIMNGKVVSSAVLNERLKNLYPMFEQGMYYGKGIMITDFKEINGASGFWIGHSGGTESYRALLIYDVRTKVFLSVAVNAHVSVEAIAGKLLSFIK